MEYLMKYTSGIPEGIILYFNYKHDFINSNKKNLLFNNTKSICLSFYNSKLNISIL